MSMHVEIEYMYICAIIIFMTTKLEKSTSFIPCKLGGVCSEGSGCSCHSPGIYSAMERKIGIFLLLLHIDL